MKRYIVAVNNNEYEVTIREKDESNKNTGQSSIKNPEKDQDNKGNKRREEPVVSGSSEFSAGELVTAPMAGKILSIKVEEGQEVSKNQLLMTLEAMKMETEIVAPEGGRIDRIFATKGSNCTPGDQLALIKKVSDVNVS